ncbi:MAG: hypothetical protein HY980_04150 [Candidatus Magasanikbacteria bacterium]|nr:hypothetical protein [Candidatus Magasanikbacteria bacterium]
MICENSGNLISFGDGATYVLATKTECKNKNSKEDEIYAKWYEKDMNCNKTKSETASTVGKSCETACADFENSGTCNF